MSHAAEARDEYFSSECRSMRITRTSRSSFFFFGVPMKLNWNKCDHAEKKACWQEPFEGKRNGSTLKFTSKLGL